MASSYINELALEIKKINPMQSAFVDGSLEELDTEEQESFTDYLRFCLDCGMDLDYLARCYDLIVKDTLREQIYFQRKKRYRYSTYSEVADSVYLNDEYMEMYMHGLAVTSFLWPNHRAMRRFFLKSIPKNMKGNYLEIGPGHGFYFISAVKTTSYDCFEGIDISPKSAEMTKNIAEKCCNGLSDNCRIICQDFLAGDVSLSSYDAVVMGEVMEHVEQPELFLQKISDITTDSPFIYISTAINAPAIDHIYLFDSVESIEAMVNRAGLVVKDSLIVPYTDLTLEQSFERKLPVNVAMVLGK